MDCETALRLMEFASPDSDDRQAPEMHRARRHLESCAECSATHASRIAFDRELSQAMPNVPIPDGLRARLLELTRENTNTAHADGAISCNATPPEDELSEHELSGKQWANGSMAQAVDIPRRQDRRYWLHALRAVVAVVLLAAMLGIWLSRSSETVTLDEVRQTANLQLDELPDFDRSFPVTLPYGWSRHPDMQFELPPKGTVQQPHSMALFAFRLSPQRRSPVHGVLVVLARDRVELAPKATYLGAADSAYALRPEGRFTTAAWTENELVFVCFVSGGTSELETLHNALRLPPT